MELVKKHSQLGTVAIRNKNEKSVTTAAKPAGEAIKPVNAAKAASTPDKNAT